MRKKVFDGDWVKFLGTAGARFVMIKQLRASGGLWLHFKGKNILIDPGPGALVRMALSRPRLDPMKLEAIILTHRHLDHSSDVNVIIEAITEGGFKKRGILFCPPDCIEKESIVLKHTREFLEEIRFLKENREYFLGDLKFSTSPRHLHPVETYGLKFFLNEKVFSLISDTRYFEKMLSFYKNSNILLINTVFFNERKGVDHLSLEDAKRLIRRLRPDLAILTHFGMTMLREKPHFLAERLKKDLGLEIIAAYDGLKIDLENV